MAIGSFTITADREKDIDFSKPFMDFKMALILLIPKEKESLFNFHKPFSGNVWLMVVLSVRSLFADMHFTAPLQGHNQQSRKMAEIREYFHTKSTIKKC